MGAIQDAYNLGDFINLDMQELVRDYILSLKEGHTRAYTAIGSLETITSDHETRITNLESVQGGHAITAERIEVTIQQLGHGFQTFQPVYYNGSSFVIAGTDAQSADGLATRIDDNNFKLLVKGEILLDPTLLDDQGAQLQTGHWYFLSATAGSYTATKPTDGLYQSLFRVYEDFNNVKRALVDVSYPYTLAGQPKLGYTAIQAYSTAGTYNWTVPADVYRIKVTLAGAGGAGGAPNQGSAGGQSTFKVNSLTIMEAFGGPAGKWDGWNQSAPNHATATGGDVNIKGGGACGGIGLMSETGGDNEGIGGQAGNGGLAIKSHNVTPQDTVTIILGQGGSGGTDSGQGTVSGNGTDGFVIIEY